MSRLARQALSLVLAGLATGTVLVAEEDLPHDLFPPGAPSGSLSDGFDGGGGEAPRASSAPCPRPCRRCGMECEQCPDGCCSICVSKAAGFSQDQAAGYCAGIGGYLADKNTLVDFARQNKLYRTAWTSDTKTRYAGLFGFGLLKVNPYCVGIKVTPSGYKKVRGGRAAAACVLQ